MSPSVFFQLSDQGKLSILTKHGLYIRERSNATYTIQLFLMDDSYYEVWKLNHTNQLIHITLIDEHKADVMFPGIREVIEK
jgi:hypothetical protein